MGKGEIPRIEQFLLFPQCFLTIRRTSCHFHQIRNCRLQTLSIWKSLKFVFWERANRPISSSAPILFYFLQMFSIWTSLKFPTKEERIIACSPQLTRNWTFKWFDPAMCNHMTFQMLRSHECFPTFFTYPFAFVCVLGHVTC